MYIHLRDKSKPLPTIEECMVKFRKIRKIRKPKEEKDEKKTSRKKADRQKDSS